MTRARRGHSALVFTIATVLTLLILVSTSWAGHPKETAGGTSAQPNVPESSTSATTHAPTHAPTRSPKATQTPAQIRAQALVEVRTLSKGLASDSVSIAAVNTATGDRFTYGATSGMWTASVYKLFVLEALLLQNGAPLTGTQADEAIPMMEQSDNVDGYDLFLAAGGNSGLAAAAKRLGLKHTVLGRSDPTFTRTNASDMLTLLGNLVRKGPLTAASRSYALGLMRQVELDQRWGVSAAADKHTVFAIKNGWLGIDNDNGPNENDNGLWVINSVGVVTVDGQQVLMAIMTQHRRDFASGVSLVEAFARAVKPLVAR